MCGIAGWFNFNNKEASFNKHLLSSMLDTIKHRGPDEAGTYFSKSTNSSLGIRRLSIIDLKTGSQPIHNEDNTVWVVCNGEIYNFISLRHELETKGHKFYTHSDIEVIVHLYEEYGKNAVKHLRGMFAFALLDERKNSFLLCRDRLGKKPLAYAVVNGSIIFGSEIKSILKYPGIDTTISNKSIDMFLTYQYIPSPSSIFENIYKLPQASLLECGASGEIKIEKYWDLDFTCKLNHSEREWEELIIGKLQESTKLRMISDVPLGAFLSGGIDSSAVVAMMARESSQPVKTFAIGFNEQEFSELKYAKIVADHLKTDHHEFVVTPDMTEILPKLAWHYGEPFADSSALPSYFVAHETRKHVTVALNGDGGDENFGGYLRYKAFLFSEIFSLFARPASPYITHISKELLKNVHGGPLRKPIFRINQVFSAITERPETRNLIWHSIFGKVRKNFIYSDDMKKSVGSFDSYAHLENIFSNAKAHSNIDRLLFTDFMSYLPECLMTKMDIASMSNSLETRSPFLDHEFVELTAKMPSQLKLKLFSSKYILKKALKGILPASILSRRKMGFGIPVNEWFRKELRNYSKDILFSSKALSRGYFDKKNLEAFYNSHLEYKQEHGYRLWALLMLELWHNEYID